NKESRKERKHLNKLVPNKISIRKQDKAQLADWKQQYC
ncbi:unnamed protein product, partial [Urochloa humidicola]